MPQREKNFISIWDKQDWEFTSRDFVTILRDFNNRLIALEGGEKMGEEQKPAQAPGNPEQEVAPESQPEEGDEEETPEEGQPEEENA